MSQSKMLRPSFIDEDTGYAYCEKHAPSSGNPAKQEDLNETESCAICGIQLMSGVESEN
jgi:hypothetical protein